MSDFEPTPDDLLVSAVLDGMASPEEVERVASDPRLSARLAEFRIVAAAVAGPVPLVDPDVRDAHLARALAEATTAVVGATPPVAPPPPPAPPTAPTAVAPPIDLAAARAKRRGPGSAAILSIAAALLVFVAVGAFVVRLGESTGSSGDDTAASSEQSTASDALSSGGDQADEGAADSGGAGESEAFNPATTTVPGGQAPATADSIDQNLPSLGTFAKGEDLAARVQGELVLDPNPIDRAADSAANEATCADDFGVEVALLGRATVAGEQGLVYVEAAPRADRRLWLVDPGTVGADDACRQIVPVQTI